jgi:hypothetical protein
MCPRSRSTDYTFGKGTSVPADTLRTLPVVSPRGNFITRNDRSKLLRAAKQRRTRPSVSARGLMKPAAFAGGVVINCRGVCRR